MTLVPERGDAFDVEGPVRAEVFVLCLVDDTIVVTGPCGPAPWYIETASGEHPVDVVRRIVSGSIGEPELVHSTSWRQSDEGVILTFFVVVDARLCHGMDAALVVRSDLARSYASTAPSTIDANQVLEHAIRHLAWLANDDDVVWSRLSPAWLGALDAYGPEPFRNLG